MPQKYLGAVVDFNRDKPATIEDVARLAGVSIATVSRAIRTPEKVAERTRKKVTAAVARTGYTANAMAINLRKQRSQMVMVLTQTIADPNFPGILTGLERIAQRRGYGVLIGNTEAAPKNEETYLRFIATGMADGLILLTGHLPVVGSPQMLGAFPPIVAATCPIEQGSFPYVGVDDVAASKVATEYLLSFGHSEVVYVSGMTGHAVNERRHKGYVAAMQGGRAPRPTWVVEGDGTSEGGRAAVERLCIRDTLPTAFFCYNDDTAVGVIKALQLRGYRVPQDFSVIGFDDIPMASHITPALTTIRQPRSQIGERAMGQLLDRLNGQAPVEGASMTALLHGDLVVRESCAQPRRAGPPQRRNA